MPFTAPSTASFIYAAHGKAFRHRALLLVGCALSLFMLAGCASTPSGSPAYDPIEKVNRGSYWFNHQLDRF